MNLKFIKENTVSSKKSHLKNTESIGISIKIYKYNKCDFTQLTHDVKDNQLT